MKKILPVIIKACQIDEANPKWAAMMIDRILMNKLQAQTYGTQVVSYNGQKWKFHKIAEEELVNQRRASVGLSPIESYAKRMKVDYVSTSQREDYKRIKMKKSWIKKGYIL